MKVYLVNDGLRNLGCFDSREEAQKLADIHNVAQKHCRLFGGTQCEVEEFEVKDKTEPPSMYFVRATANIPFLSIVDGDDVDPSDRMNTSIDVKPDIDEDLEDPNRYNLDTISTIIYSSRISIYFYFRMKYVENETTIDLYKRAQQLFEVRLAKFKEKKEYEEIIKISHMYKDMKARIDEVQKSFKSE